MNISSTIKLPFSVTIFLSFINVNNACAFTDTITTIDWNSHNCILPRYGNTHDAMKVGVMNDCWVYEWLQPSHTVNHRLSENHPSSSSLVLHHMQTLSLWMMMHWMQTLSLWTMVEMLDDIFNVDIVFMGDDGDGWVVTNENE